MKLLFVDTDEFLLNRLLKYFKKAGYTCEFATTYKEGYKKLQTHNYEGVILGLKPDGIGLKLLRYARTESLEIILIITSTDTRLDTKLTVFAEGADDFLPVPFHHLELEARLKAVIKRQRKNNPKSLIFKGLRLEIEERQVYVEGQPLQLTRKEYEILFYLIRNKNRVITKETLAEYLWGDHMEEAVSFDFLYSQVKNLRKKLGQNGGAEYLKTIYGVGYKFSDNL